MLKFLETKQLYTNHSTNAMETGYRFKKGLLLALCVIATTCSCFAQDIIITKDAMRLNVIVVRTNPDNIRYKYFDNQNGPTFTILKSQIASILYQDGQVETFTSESTSTVTSPVTSTVTSPVTSTVTSPVQTQRSIADNYKPVAVSRSEKTTNEAYTDDVRTRWGIKAGINIATVNLDNSSNSYSMGSVVGVVAGITLDQPFTPTWFFHSGLELSMKGFEMNPGSSSTLKATAVYLQLPAAIGYKFNIGKGWKLEPRLGLFFASGIGGNTTATTSTQYGSTKTFDGKILNSFDYGALFGGFFDNDSFVIGLHGESGLSETNGDNFRVTGAKAHSSNVSITIGYLF